MKYRARAIGLFKDGHPVQVFSAHEQTVFAWARDMAATERVNVEIGVYEERIIQVIEPPPLPKVPDAKLG